MLVLFDMWQELISFLRVFSTPCTMMYLADQMTRYNRGPHTSQVHKSSRIKLSRKAKISRNSQKGSPAKVSSYTVVHGHHCTICICMAIVSLVGKDGMTSTHNTILDWIWEQSGVMRLGNCGCSNWQSAVRAVLRMPPGSRKPNKMSLTWWKQYVRQAIIYNTELINSISSKSSVSHFHISLCWN